MVKLSHRDYITVRHNGQLFHFTQRHSYYNLFLFLLNCLHALNKKRTPLWIFTPGVCILFGRNAVGLFCLRVCSY